MNKNQAFAVMALFGFCVCYIRGISKSIYKIYANGKTYYADSFDADKNGGIAFLDRWGRLITAQYATIIEREQ